MTQQPLHPLMSIENTTLQKLSNGDATSGIFCVSGSALIVECCASHGFDWLVLDIEASPLSRSELTHCLQAMNGSSTTSLTRVDSHQKCSIEAVLDAGSSGIIVPKVDNAEQALAIVDAAYYPPMGNRGLNPIRCSAYFNNLSDYVTKANEQILCLAQIETREALENVSEISAIDGIDGVFVGCGDLSMQLGCFGEMTHPKMNAAIDRVLEACREHNKIPGVFAYSDELAVHYRKLGYQFIAVGNDIKFLNAGIQLTKSAIDSECEQG